VICVDVFSDVLLAGRIALRQMDFVRSDHGVLEVLGEGGQTPTQADFQPALGAFEFGSRTLARLAGQFDAVGIAGREKAVFVAAVNMCPLGKNSEPLSSNSTGPVRSVFKAHWAMSLVWQPKLAVCPLE